MMDKDTVELVGLRDVASGKDIEPVRSESEPDSFSESVRACVEWALGGETEASREVKAEPSGADNRLDRSWHWN